MRARESRDVQCFLKVAGRLIKLAVISMVTRQESHEPVRVELECMTLEENVLPNELLSLEGRSGQIGTCGKCRHGLVHVSPRPATRICANPSVGDFKSIVPVTHFCMGFELCEHQWTEVVLINHEGRVAGHARQCSVCDVIEAMEGLPTDEDIEVSKNLMDIILNRLGKNDPR